jgi:hypothetical protein
MRRARPNKKSYQTANQTTYPIANKITNHATNTRPDQSTDQLTDKGIKLHPNYCTLRVCRASFQAGFAN